jgi:hypothetical protein
MNADDADQICVIRVHLRLNLFFSYLDLVKPLDRTLSI